MNEKDEVTERDRKLLEEIEQIALHGNVDRQQEDSLYGFCAHLASTVPQAKQEYQQRLDTQMAVKWRQIYGAQVEKDSKGRYGHFQAWSRHHPEYYSISHSASKAEHRSLRRTTLAWAAIAVLIFISFSLVFVPPVRALASQLIRELILGSYSSVKQVELESKTEFPATTENRWMIETILGGSGGVLPPGADPTVRSLTSIQEAQKHTNLLLGEPGYLPSGFALREVRLPPAGASEEQAYLFYGNPDREIVLFMSRVGEGPDEAPGLTTIKVSVIATNGSIEEVTVGEHLAAWIDGEMLAWESGNILYEIGGRGLSLNTALRIAESIP